MLILAQSSEGTELFNQISAADILFTSKEDLFKSGALYLVVSVVIFLFYNRLISGSLSVLIAMYLSYVFDLPTGYSIIFVLVLVTLVSVWIIEIFIKFKDKL
jgi:ABC-type Mn2+/Zn2+ transport system permease subunit